MPDFLGEAELSSVGHESLNTLSFSLFPSFAPFRFLFYDDRFKIDNRFLSKSGGGSKRWFATFFDFAQIDTSAAGEQDLEGRFSLRSRRLRFPSL
jgi:hypothetical protein